MTALSYTVQNGGGMQARSIFFFRGIHTNTSLVQNQCTNERCDQSITSIHSNTERTVMNLRQFPRGGGEQCCGGQLIPLSTEETAACW